MDIAPLQYFVHLAKCENMTKASQVLNISQPALSSSIKKLEKSLGIELFTREGRGLVLNEYGKRYLAHVESALSILEAGETELALMHNSSSVLSIDYWTSSSMIPEMLVAFSEAYPYLKVNASSGIQNYSFKFSFFSYSTPPDEGYEILLQEEICIAVPLNNPLSELDEISSLNELKDEKFICVSPSLPFRKMSDEFCRISGFTPNIILENEDFRTLEHLLNLGVGISFWPAKTWYQSISANKKYKLLRIAHPICMRTIYMSWPDDLEENIATTTFRKFVKIYWDTKYNRKK